MAQINLIAIHPGEILREEFLIPLGLSAGQLARHLKVPRTRIERIVAEASPITVDTALRLARYFRTSPEFWINMQTRYDLSLQAEALREELATITAREAA
jgi:addiction module HigA family antidote